MASQDVQHVRRRPRHELPGNLPLELVRGAHLRRKAGTPARPFSYFICMYVYIYIYTYIHIYIYIYINDTCNSCVLKIPGLDFGIIMECAVIPVSVKHTQTHTSFA